MTATTILILGGLGLALLWLGLYVIDEEVSRALDRQQARRWKQHLDKPLSRRL